MSTGLMLVALARKPWQVFTREVLLDLIAGSLPALAAVLPASASPSSSPTSG